jgi:hypothetical protein
VTDDFDITTEAAPDPMPTGPALSNVVVNDEDPVNIDAGGVVDSLGRTIVYGVSGLPSGVGVNTSSISIDANTGIISGLIDIV